MNWSPSLHRAGGKPLQEILHRFRERIDMTGRAGDGLRNHASLGVEQPGRKVAGLAHGGGEGGAHAASAPAPRRSRAGGSRSPAVESRCVRSPAHAVPRRIMTIEPSSAIRRIVAGADDRRSRILDDDSRACQRAARREFRAAENGRVNQRAFVRHRRRPGTTSRRPRGATGAAATTARRRPSTPCSRSASRPGFRYRPVDQPAVLLKIGVLECRPQRRDVSQLVSGADRQR